MLELNEREKLERERDTRREREKKKEGGREGGEAGVRREGKARQDKAKIFFGKKAVFGKRISKKLTTILLDPYNSTLLSGSTSFLEVHSFRFVTICPS